MTQRPEFEPVSKVPTIKRKRSGRFADAIRYLINNSSESVRFPITEEDPAVYLRKAMQGAARAQGRKLTVRTPQDGFIYGTLVNPLKPNRTWTK